MMAGGIDVMVEVPPDNLATFEQDANFAVAEQAGPHVWFTILNTKEGPFADKRVRQAANYAVNKQTLVDDVLQGTATVAAGPIPPAFNWVESSVEPYAHDPEKAKALLAEAGVENPQVTFYVTEGGSGMLDPITMGAAIQADLQAVGFKVKIETYEWNTFLGRVNPGLEGKADMAEMAWMTNDPDTVPYLTLRTDAMPDKGGFNSGYYSNPQLDELLEKARRSTDQAERGKLMARSSRSCMTTRVAFRRQLEAERGDDRRRQGFQAAALLPPRSPWRDERVARAPEIAAACSFCRWRPTRTSPEGYPCRPMS